MYNIYLYQRVRIHDFYYAFFKFQKYLFSFINIEKFICMYIFFFLVNVRMVFKN